MPAFKEVLNNISILLDEAGLGLYVSRKWVFRKQYPVVDFLYRDIEFSVDFVMSGDELFSVDVVRRKCASIVPPTSKGQRKERLAQGVSLGRAIELLQPRVRSIVAKVDAGTPSLTTDKPTDSRLLLERLLLQPRQPQKVGILTLPFNVNIGGNLQGYALMEVLRQIGHTPILINRRPSAIEGGENDQKKDADIPLITNKISMSGAPNRAFIERYVTPITQVFRTTEDLKNKFDRYGFDAVIVGSDQVWRPRYIRANFSDFFLGFIEESNKNTKRISYAASFGTEKWEYDAEQTEIARSLIKRFDAIGVREDSGVDLVRTKFDATATHVLDPTMLLRAEHYEPLVNTVGRRPSDGQLLCYILDRSDDKTRVVKSLMSQLEVLACSTDGLPFEFSSQAAADTKQNYSVEGWLASFRNASFVITDSFHGAVFSIIFNKPFIAYGNPRRGIDRFKSLMKILGLEDRLVANFGQIDISAVLRPIDWAAINQRLDDMRLHSVQFLIEALSSRSAIDQSGKLTVQSAHEATSIEEHPLKVMCTGCGVCVSEAKGTLRMSWNADGFLVPQVVSGPVPAEAVRVCPFNPRPEKAVEDEDVLGRTFLPVATRFDPRGGRFENSYIGYSKEFRPTSSSGGIATYVFSKLLSEGHVDYIFIVQTDGASGYKYQVLDRSSNITKMSKTRYYPVSLNELFNVIDSIPGRVAVSGVACFIKAIRLKQHYHPNLKERIPFLVGILCGGLKSRFYTDFLAQSVGIDGEYRNVEYRVKDPKSTSNDYSFAATDAQSQIHQVKMSGFGDMWGSGLFKSKACDFCTDVMTELADISLGDAWLPKYRPDGMGTSVIVTRSPLAEKIIQQGIKSEELVIDLATMDLLLQSQGGGTGHKHQTMKFRVWLSTYFSDLPVPFVRARFFKAISLTDAWVQLHRERTRSKSLAYWRATRNVKLFKKQIRAARKGLILATAARKVLRENGSHPLAEAIATRRLEALESKMADANGENRIMMRWVRRRVRGQQVNFELLRSALLSAEIIAVPDKSATKVASQPPWSSSGPVHKHS